MVECHLAKVKVASPNLVSRSTKTLDAQVSRVFYFPWGRFSHESGSLRGKRKGQEMSEKTLTICLLKDTYGIARLESAAAVPEWAMSGEFFSVTRTPDELSVVCPLIMIPAGAACERDWRILKIEGPLDFSLVGILAALSEVLARAGISIFAVSTYDTDYILVKGKDLANAVLALRACGHEVRD